MGIFLFLLSFPAAIAAWVFIAKKLKASGKNAAVRHFAGVAAGFFVWVFVIMIGIKADEGKTEEAQTAQAASEPARVATPAAASSAQPQAMAEKAAEPPEEQVVEKVATLDLDWETFRRRVNEDFASVDFGAKIPASIKPEGSKNSVRDVAMLPFNDHLFSNIAVDPQSKQLTSISVTVGPSENSVENIKNFSAAALLLSAAAGDDGMCLEQLFGAGGAHLGGDHAFEVILQGDDVDGGDPLLFGDELQRSLKTLVLPAFPVEVEADDHLLQLEALPVHLLRFEGEFRVLFTLKHDPLRTGFHTVISRRKRLSVQRVTGKE